VIGRQGKKRSHSNSNQLKNKWGVGCITFIATDDVTERVVYKQRPVRRRKCPIMSIGLRYVALQTAIFVVIDYYKMKQM